MVAPPAMKPTKAVREMRRRDQHRADLSHAVLHADMDPALRVDILRYIASPTR
jgi:hypothetical protein